MRPSHPPPPSPHEHAARATRDRADRQPIPGWSPRWRTPARRAYFEVLEGIAAERLPGPLADALTDMGLSEHVAQRLTAWGLWTFINVEPTIGEVIRSYL
jgi:hypothetical protein